MFSAKLACIETFDKRDRAFRAERKLRGDDERDALIVQIVRNACIGRAHLTVRSVTARGADHQRLPHLRAVTRRIRSAEYCCGSDFATSSAERRHPLRRGISFAFGAFRVRLFF